MKYRIAGASYRTIAEKLTEDRAHAYADEHGVSIERAMRKITHVSVRTVWDDVTAEYEELRRETEVNRADSMALENARLDQGFSKALSLFANGSEPGWPTGYRDDGTALPFRCRIVAGTRPAASRCRARHGDAEDRRREGLTAPKHPRLLPRFLHGFRCPLVGPAGLARRRRVQLLSGPGVLLRSGSGTRGCWPHGEA